MTYDVVVVGGGPSGLTVASELALAGAKVKVLERRQDFVQSRAGTILPRVLELLDTRDLAERFIAQARTIRPDPLFTTHIWAGMQPVHWKHLRSRFGFRMILPQNYTEEILLRHATSLGVDFERGAHFNAVEQDVDSVRVAYDTDSGVAQRIDAAWLVGADGGRSGVRRAIGMPFRGHDTTFTGIIADVVADFNWAAERRMADNEHGWVTSFPFSSEKNVYRFNIVHAQRRRVPATEPVTVDEVRACVREVLERDIPITELRWASRFGDAQRIVDRLRDGRVLLVGEAARIHYPASGVGMNFCIQDAFNLGWKLAAVVNGHAEQSLLDTYDTERMPVSRALLRSVECQIAVQFDFSSEGVAFKRMFQTHLMPMEEVNGRLAHELNGLTEPYPSTDGHPLSGRPVPDADLMTAEGRTRIGVLLRHGGWLLLDLTGGGAYDDLPSAELPVRRLAAKVSTPDPRLDRVNSLLVRPDGYVAWASADAPDPERAGQELARWLKLPG